MTPDLPVRAALPTALIALLQERFAARFTQAAAVCLQHGTDESVHAPQPPDAVVFVETTEEVAQLARWSQQYQVPLIPYGAGSSVEGHLQAVRGGISVDLSAMQRVCAIHPEDMDATVEAGVTRKQLNEALKGSGLFFPIDPGADASLGGMAATRASGTNAVRYGTMRDNVMALTVVLPDGEVIRTGSRARKSSAGYDLTRLFVGSEGTLGIITELTLRLHPLPEAMSAAVCAFPDVAAAVNTVIATIQMGVPVARIELLDALTLKAVNQYSKTTLAEQPTLFFEFHGSSSAVAEQAELVEALAAEQGASGFAWATRPEERSRLWQARHDAYFACLQLKPGCRAFSTDVCVPISRLAECIAATQADIAEVRLQIAVLGHVGDGNFHLVVLVDPHDAEDLRQAKWISERVVARALAMDGTCTGEHGVGLGKVKFMEAEHGAAAIALMRRLKTAIDPQQLLNPGKILPPAAGG